MNNSVNFAFFFSLYFLIVGLASLLNTNYILSASKQILKNQGLMLIGGFMALIFGLLIISFHPYYRLDWPLLITIIGWMSLLKGILYTFSESIIQKIAAVYCTKKAIRSNGFLALFLSGIFAYMIFMLN